MRKFAVLGLLALAACAPGTSSRSPSADSVFTQAVTLLQGRYYGFELPKLPTVIASGKAALERACANLSPCPPEAAQQTIDQMLDQLGDPHSFLETPAQYAESQRIRSGQGGSFPVLGIRSIYRPSSNSRLIIESMPGLVAEAAGLGRGDLIIGLNGQALPKGDSESNLALREQVRSGREFTLNIRRAGKERDVKVTGRLATVPSLPSLKTWAGVPSSVAILRIPDYLPPQTADIAHKLVNQAIKNGAKSIVLDLRSNAGGRATECISVAGIFMGRTGVTFATKDSQEQYIYESGRVTSSTGIRVGVSESASFAGNVAVLVDKQSASCAEVTPALLQSAKRSTIIGEPTYGILNTGTLSFPLQDGSGLTITTMRTLDLDRNPLASRVTPDIAQPEDLDALENSARDIMLERAVRVVQGLDTTAPNRGLHQNGLPRVPLVQWQDNLN
ncbi:MAG: S41 family peptidase [Deinococcales bacterium]